VNPIKPPGSFTIKVKGLIKRIPEGQVATYGLIAAMAGNPRAARQVARILHACSSKDHLPWHRVVNRKGQISLKPTRGYEIQKMLLEKEGVLFSPGDTIDFDRYLWRPERVQTDLIWEKNN
jgi:methylated-DNA-protein-cysteine methyltransferase-like protein